MKFDSLTKFLTDLDFHVLFVTDNTVTVQPFSNSDITYTADVKDVEFSAALLSVLPKSYEVLLFDGGFVIAHPDFLVEFPEIEDTMHNTNDCLSFVREDHKVTCSLNCLDKYHWVTDSYKMPSEVTDEICRCTRFKQSIGALMDAISNYCNNPETSLDDAKFSEFLKPYLRDCLVHCK